MQIHWQKYKVSSSKQEYNISNYGKFKHANRNCSQNFSKKFSSLTLLSCFRGQ